MHLKAKKKIAKGRIAIVGNRTWYEQLEEGNRREEEPAPLVVGVPCSSNSPLSMFFVIIRVSFVEIWYEEWSFWNEICERRERVEGSEAVRKKEEDKVKASPNVQMNRARISRFISYLNDLFKAGAPNSSDVAQEMHN